MTFRQLVASSCQSLRHADHLAAPVRPDADGHRHTHVLDRPAPRTLVPHAVHERIRVGLLQRALPPLVDPDIYFLQPVRQGLRWHTFTPQGLADVVDPTGGDTGQIHVDQRFLDRLLPPPVAFDNRRLEDRPSTSAPSPPSFRP